MAKLEQITAISVSMYFNPIITETNYIKRLKKSLTSSLFYSKPCFNSKYINIKSAYINIYIYLCVGVCRNKIFLNTFSKKKLLKIIHFPSFFKLFIRNDSI